MRKLTEQQLARRAQELADTMHELAKIRETAAKVRKDWASKIKRYEERAAMLGEAVRLKTDADEQQDLPIHEANKDGES
jgi:biotin-(acetyl-CoA carboxylase) ligase